MPFFVKDYLMARSKSKEATTRYAYLIDLRVFLRFLKENNPLYKDVAIKDMDLEVLKNVTPRDINEYVNYLSAYEGTNGYQSNENEGIRRKLAALSAMYTYYCRSGELTANPVGAIELPKKVMKKNVFLEDDEIERIFQAIESGSTMSESGRKRFHDATKYRDLAIVTLLLSSGIRVSELVGLNLTDIDFDHPLSDSEGNIVYRSVVTRKGGDDDYVYLTEDTVDIIRIYMEENRPGMLAGKGDENEQALFLSLRGKRISVGSVEALIKKYTKTTVPTKNIHPHSFRKTRGTRLYNETGDLQLTANVLGDKTLDVVSRHYVSVYDSKKINAAHKGQKSE